MAAAKPRRRLIVNADDFGLSESVNRAVIEAHRRGILTTASLMVTGKAFEQAVELARANPGLGVGLHLTLCRGRSVLTKGEIPSLVDDGQQFSSSPFLAGLKYFFSRRARAELQAEVAAQFDRFAKCGLPLDHVNGHLHFHMHPGVVCRLRGKAARLTYNPCSVDWPLGKGRVAYRLSHAVIFFLLSRCSRRIYQRAQLRHTDHVFGLLENGRVHESYILKLLAVLPPGDSELYAHPSLDGVCPEFEALVSPRVRETLHREEIQLIRYQDL